MSTLICPRLAPINFTATIAICLNKFCRPCGNKKKCKILKRRSKKVSDYNSKVKVIFEEKTFSGNNNISLPVGCYCDHLTHRAGSVGSVYF